MLFSSLSKILAISLKVNPCIFNTKTHSSKSVKVFKIELDNSSTSSLNKNSISGFKESSPIKFIKPTSSSSSESREIASFKNLFFNLHINVRRV